MSNPYDTRYEQEDYYWGVKPSDSCFKVLDFIPPDRPLTLLDVGCGEGRNAVFFASKGYTVTAFDAFTRWYREDETPCGKGSSLTRGIRGRH